MPNGRLFLLVSVVHIKTLIFVLLLIWRDIQNIPADNHGMNEFCADLIKVFMLPGSWEASNCILRNSPVIDEQFILTISYSH